MNCGATAGGRVSDASDRAVGPADMLQSRIWRVWQEVLGTSRIGIDEEFVTLGGSELAERMFAMLPKIAATPLSPGDWTGPLTVRALAAEINRGVEAEAISDGGTAARAARPASGLPSQPGHVLEDRIAALWETLLERSPFGMTEDFFSLGGTQELAGRMLEELRGVTGEQVALADSPRPLTVRSLADLLVARVPRTLGVTVQEGRPGVAPVVVLHGDLGGAGYYVREIAQQLGPGRPILALAPHGMFGDEVPDTVEKMASDHVNRVQAWCPAGPIHLAGLCAGGVVAWEMARALVSQGREIASLVLIDPAVPGGARRDTPLPPPDLSARARSMPPIRTTRLLSWYIATCAAYRYQPYPGRVSVLWAADHRHTLDSPERRATLSALAPQAEMTVCPGTHISAPGRYVGSLSAKLERILQSASPSPIPVTGWEAPPVTSPVPTA
jgi:pimeloyl-ACP methyl ester carboxylesterase